METEMLTEDQAAIVLQLATKTLQAWGAQRKGPPYVKLGRAVRYRRVDIDRFIEQNVQQITRLEGVEQIHMSRK